MTPKSTSPTRRTLGVGGGVVLGAGALGGSYPAWTMRRRFEGGALDPVAAHALAVAREIFLIIMRRHDEWRATGVGEGAIPLDTRRADFTARLREVRADAPDRPAALICARGVRSSRLTARLKAEGMDDVLDVAEGMLGSPAGPDTIGRGRPVVSPAQAGRAA